MTENLQAKLRGTQGALKRAQNAYAKVQDRLREIYAAVGLPENASFDTLVSVLRGKGEQSGERLADNEELRLLLKAVCAALALPEEATKKDIVDALVALSDYGLAGKLLAEAVSQAWTGKPLQQITTMELVSNLQMLQRFRDKLNVLLAVQKPISYDELYAKVESAVGRADVGTTWITNELCAVLSLPQNTEIPAIIATVKGLLERAGIGHESNPDRQVLDELRGRLGLPEGAHPAAVGSKVGDLWEKALLLDELHTFLEPLPEEDIIDRVREVVDISRLNRDAADAADHELTETRKKLARVEYDLRVATFAVTKIAALGSVLGTLCDNALDHVEKRKESEDD
jgi:hypothetical protein